MFGISYLLNEIDCHKRLSSFIFGKFDKDAQFSNSKNEIHNFYFAIFKCLQVLVRTCCFFFLLLHAYLVDQFMAQCKPAGADLDNPFDICQSS